MALEPRGGGDGFVDCSCGSRHWGRLGAAGLLVHRAGRVLLQHRAHFLQEGGTWALPGGARDVGESAVQAALREATEEAGVPAGALRLRHAWTVDHGTWSYTTVVADAVTPLQARDLDGESLEVRWVDLGDVPTMPLHSGLAAGWPALRDLVALREALVVDVPDATGSTGPPDVAAVHRAVRVIQRHGLTEPSGLLSEAPGRTRAWPRAVLSTGEQTWRDQARTLLASGHRVTVVAADEEVRAAARSRGADAVPPRRLVDAASSQVG